MVFGLGGRVHDSQNQFLSFETPEYLQKIKKIPIQLENILFLGNLKFWKMRSSKCWNRFGKNGHQEMMTIRLTNLGNLEYGINIYRKHEKAIL